MKKIYFLIASLFISMGAMAQETVVNFDVNDGITEFNNDLDLNARYWTSTKVEGLTMSATMMSDGTEARAIDVLTSNNAYSLKACFGKRGDYSGVNYTIALTEECGYKIVGYKFCGEAYKALTIEAAGNTYDVANGEQVEVNVECQDVLSTTFSVKASVYHMEAALDIVSFEIYLEKEAETGVESVEVAQSAKVIYDLTGRRVDSMEAAGIYIVNGKKVMVK